MWCSYEKLCKLCPTKIETSKIFSELNPKILIFNKKHQANRANNMNSNNIITSTHQPKDFSLSPDNFNNMNKYNSTENKCLNANSNNLINQNSKPINRFDLISSNNSNYNNENEGVRVRGHDSSYHAVLNSNHSKGNFNLFPNNNITNTNMTPVLNKDKVDQDYHNMNYNHPLISYQDLI